MIMMRSTPVIKTGKPPPPVPPRPSKTIVAEALAKTKKITTDDAIKVSNHSAPMRIAPPPPPQERTKNNNDNLEDDGDKRNSIKKTQSYSAVNIFLNKPPIFDRTTSLTEEIKNNNSRTVVFQSSNMKTANTDDRMENKSKFISRVDSIHNKHATIKDKHNENVNSNGTDKIDTNWNEILNDRNHVNTLIDEMFASVLDVSGDKIEQCESRNEYVNIAMVPKSEDNKIQVSSDKTTVTINNHGQNDCQNSTVLVIDDCSEEDSKKINGMSNDEDMQRKQIKFNDKMNHEFLISELQDMKREQDRIRRRQRKPSVDGNDIIDPPKIHHSDWIEVNNGQEVHLSSCQITIQELNDKENEILLDESIISRLSAMSSLHGLPPLPKSLSGFSLLDNPTAPQTPSRATSSRGTTPPSGSSHLVYPPHPKSVNGADATGRKSTNLDTQLAILRREMYSLRQLDLSLLSQLWSLNESIQDFRQMLQDQDDRILSPPSPSPTQSSADDGEADEFYSPSPMRFRPAPPPPPLRRPSNSSSGTSSVW